MTTGLREGLGLHADALALRGYRNTLLASNIANAAVPHYKARDFDFEQVLADRTGSLQTLRATEAGHMPTAQAALSDEAGYRVPVMSALDGNTVDMAVEQMEFAENTVRYQASLEFLNRRVTGLMSVIRGE